MGRTLKKGTNPQAQMQLGMTLYILALLIEHCNFEVVAMDNSSECLKGPACKLIETTSGINSELRKITDVSTT